MKTQMRFKATSDDHVKYNGPVTILRELTTEEADIEDVGMMYKCQASNGETFDAFDDELTSL